MATVEYKGNTKLDDEYWQDALFAQEAYQDPEEREDFGEWKYDRELSDSETAVYHNHQSQLTHLAFRGSTTAYDWAVSDIQIATGTESLGRRFNRDVDNTRNAHDKYGYDTKTSGHSLAGRSSEFVTETLGDNDWYIGGVGFNPGNSSLGNSSYLKRKVVHDQKCGAGDNRHKYCDKQLNIKQKSDVVSNYNVLSNPLFTGISSRMFNSEKSDAFGKTIIYDNDAGCSWYNPFCKAVSRPIRAHSMSNWLDFEK